MDAAGPGRPPEAYRDLARRLSALPAAIEMKQFFQVDLTATRSDVRLGPAVREALESGIELLQRITPPKRKDAFKAFREAFQTRYEGRWVPLLEALDPESGIGFEEKDSTLAGELPLLEGLDFPRGGDPPRPFSPREAFLMRRVESLGDRQDWELTDADLEALTHGDPSPLPDAFAAMTILAAPAQEDVDAGRFQFLLEHYHGPSGVRLLGRFSALDPDLESKVRAHLDKEAALRPDVILAEVVHLSEGRCGNLLRRPRLRDWEIPFKGAGSAPESHQIPLQDLQVTVVADRVLLRSERLGRQIRPRLTSAHNYAEGLGAYRFLGKLQDEDGHTGGWAWGCLEHRAFLPRVRRGRHVLARAAWRVEAEEIREALAAQGNDAFRAFQAFRRARRLPRFVVLADRDKHLKVDLDHPLWVETLLHEVAKRSHFLLQECFPEAGQLPTRGPGGAYVHEVIVPFLRREPATSPRPVLPPPLHGVVRRHAPGSEWLYLKLYSGARTADALLAEQLRPLLAETGDLWDRWHFVRYADPEPHLRLRFHGRPERLLGELLPRIHATLEPCLAEGRCWKIQLDTYVPEWERYGGPRGLAAAEEVFFRDSEAVLALLDASERNQDEERRWRLGLLAMDDLMGRLGLGLEARLRLASEARDAFAVELGVDEDLQIQLGHRFRAVRGSLEAMLFQGSDPEAAAVLAERAEGLGSALAILEDAEARGEITTTRANLAMQYNHMTLNRLFHSAQRVQELVLYDFLGRLYRGRLAQSAKVRRDG
jgi:thiopeptide-type bacteriocin biosynthesis protein